MTIFSKELDTLVNLSTDVETEDDADIASTATAGQTDLVQEMARETSTM